MARENPVKLAQTFSGQAHVMIKRKKDGKKKSDKKKNIRHAQKSDKMLRPEFLVLPAARSLPWCLFVPAEGKISDYPGSLSDFVIRNLLSEFKIISGQKIRDFLHRMEENQSLSEFFRVTNNGHFHQILNSFVSISRKTSITFAFHALLQWRAYQYQRTATEKCDKNSIKQTTNTNSKDGQNIMLEEWHTLAIEYILGYTLLRLLEKPTVNNTLEESDLQRILELCVENCRTCSKPTPPAVDNKKEVFDIYSQLLGILSRYNFLSVIEITWADVPDWVTSHKSKTHTLALAHIESLKYIYLDVQSAFGLQNSHTFLMQFAKILKTAKLSKDTRAELSNTSVHMLRRVALQPFNPELEGEYKELVKGFLTSSYNLFSGVKRKQKEPAQTLYPLLSALLSCTDEKFFLENWISLCSSMQPLLAKKNVRTVLLESIKLLLQTYESKFARKDAQLSIALDSLASLVFFPNKNTKATNPFQGESLLNLELLVDIAMLFAKLNLDFAMMKICFVFFREDILGVSQPEKLFIATRTVFDIYDFYSSQPHASLMEQFLPSICDFFSKLLRSLDGIYGNWLLFNQSRTVSECIQREKLNAASFMLLRNCLSHMPPVIPSGMSEAELVAILTRYLIHIDGDIRERAWNILSSLMKKSETHRPHIIFGMTKYLLSIPDMKATIIRGVMSKLLKMINFWIFIRSQQMEKIITTSKNSNNSHVISRLMSFEIEGIALIFLCNPNMEVRDLALEIMMGVRRLSSLDETNPAFFSPTRIIDIIEQSGKDIIDQLRTDFEEVPFPTDLPIVSIKTLAVSTHEKSWAYCLSKLVYLANELCPEVIDSVRNIFTIRVEEISKTGVPVEQEGLLSLWRNYLTTTCIITHQPVPAKELFSVISPFLQKDTHHDSALFALRRGNIKSISALEKLFEMDSLAKKSKKRDKLRADLGYILAYQSSRFPPLFLQQRLRVKNLAIQYIMESLSAHHTQLDGVVDEQVISNRNSFCIVVKNIATHLYCEGEEQKNIMEKGLRSRLFALFSKWTENGCRIDPGYSEATVKKRKVAGGAIPASANACYKMQQLTCLATASLLHGPSFTPSPITIQDPILIWIAKMAKSERQEIRDTSVDALTYYLESNPDFYVTSIALDRCYSPEKEVADTYFLAIVKTFKYGTLFPSISHAVLLHLILHKVGDSSIRIRKASIEFLHILAALEKKEEKNWATRYNPTGIESTLFEVYHTIQLDLSNRLADNYPELTYEVFTEMIYRVDKTNVLHQKLMLEYIQAWIRKMDFSVLGHPQLLHVIKKLFWITITFFDIFQHVDALGTIWETLAGCANNNISLLIDGILSIGVNKRNISFIVLAKRIVYFLSRSNSKVAIDTLVSELSTITVVSLRASSSFIPMPPTDGTEEQTFPKIEPPGSSLFDCVMPDIKEYQAPARGHLALLLLAELSFLPNLAHELSAHLPILLQQVFLGADHSNSIVHDHCRILLQNLISLLIVLPESQKPNWEENENLIEGRQLFEFLDCKKGTHFWEREDISCDHVWIESADQLCSLVVQVIDILNSRFPSLREEWGSEALAWATNCPDYHWVCRSFQMYRAINPDTNPESLNKIMGVLMKLLQKEVDGCGMELEILYTLQVIATTANTNRLVLFNQLFWCATALLNSDYNVIYLQATSIISIILERVSFEDKAVQHVFEASRPTEWPASAPGIQPLLLRGLLDTSTDKFAIHLMIKITPLMLDDIFHPGPTRLLTSILALQPWICICFHNLAQRRNVQKAASHLAKACDRAGHSDLAALYATLSSSSSSPFTVNDHGGGVGSFITNWCKEFAKVFLPQYTRFTFTMLTEFLHNGHSQYYRFVLRLIQYLIKSVTLNEKEFKGKIPHWFGLVSQLVLSEIWQDALLVLESAAEQCPLGSDMIDMEVLRPFRSIKKVPNFINRAGGEGNSCAAGCLKLLLSFEDPETSQNPGNMISPRAFAKFFSENDMKQQQQEEEPVDNQEEDAESEELGESEEFEEPDIDFRSNPTGAMSFGMLDQMDNWNPASGFDCFDDLLADLDDEVGDDLEASF